MVAPYLVYSQGIDLNLIFPGRNVDRSVANKFFFYCGVNTHDPEQLFPG